MIKGITQIHNNKLYNKYFVFVLMLRYKYNGNNMSNSLQHNTVYCFAWKQKFLTKTSNIICDPPR